MSISPLVAVLLLLCLSFGGTKSEPKLSSHLQSNVAEEFECVDIHKQPAFNHPLLKNHKIQMKPSLMPKFERNSESSFGKYAISEDQIKECPKGMVPIRRNRLDENELNELRSFAKSHLGAYSNIQPLTKEYPNKHFAVMSASPEGVAGMRATTNIYNPPVKMNQVSISTFWLENGEGAELSSIQAGWGVHPLIYGDNRTRLTTYWTADGSQKTGCYNSMCPGFIQVHPGVALGYVFPNISVVGGRQFFCQPTIYKDKPTGDYWLMWQKTIILGYWPSEILNKLRVGLGSVKYGAWTSSSPDGVSPPMGSGTQPSFDFSKASMFFLLQVMNDNGEFADAMSGIQTFVDNTTCYALKWYGYGGEDLGSSFAYGGKGGICGV